MDVGAWSYDTATAALGYVNTLFTVTGASGYVLLPVLGIVATVAVILYRAITGR